jgi:hypothetical protein
LVVKPEAQGRLRIPRHPRGKKESSLKYAFPFFLSLTGQIHKRKFELVGFGGEKG